jgi:hypothetical protein
MVVNTSTIISTITSIIAVVGVILVYISSWWKNHSMMQYNPGYQTRLREETTKPTDREENVNLTWIRSSRCFTSSHDPVTVWVLPTAPAQLSLSCTSYTNCLTATCSIPQINSTAFRLMHITCPTLRFTCITPPSPVLFGFDPLLSGKHAVYLSYSPSLAHLITLDNVNISLMSTAA